MKVNAVITRMSKTVLRMDVGSVMAVLHHVPSDETTQMVAPPVMAVTSVRERETAQDFKLLQKSAYARDGRSRIPTPDKTAIMTLSKSFGKHRLGKQQQLLQDITLRCREQEVFDLSFSISKKVNFAEGPNRESTTTSGSGGSPRGGGAGSVANRKSAVAVSMAVSVAKLPADVVDASVSGSVTGGAVVAAASEAGCESVGPARSESSSLGNTKFPTRKVLRSPRKDAPRVSSLPRLNISYRKGVTPSDAYYHKAVVLNQQQINGQIQLHHYIQPRADQLAPLVLPSIRAAGVGLDDSNVNTYIQARRLNISVTPRAAPRAEIRISARR